MRKDELGRRGEYEACKYLESLDYFIIAKNFCSPYGEIDIIAIDKKELVFIEVKTRCSKKYGEARDAINKIKKKHIMKTAKLYVYKYRLENSFIRFDVIEVYVSNEKYKINHIKNILW